MHLFKEERKGKRKNINRWRMSRMIRLEFEESQGRITPRQLARLNQLERKVRGNE